MDQYEDIPQIDVPEHDAPVFADDPVVAEPMLGNFTYENLENPDTGNTVDWSSSEGYTDTNTGEPVDYWKTESTS